MNHKHSLRFPLSLLLIIFVPQYYSDSTWITFEFLARGISMYITADANFAGWSIWNLNINFNEHMAMKSIGLNYKTSVFESAEKVEMLSSDITTSWDQLKQGSIQNQKPSVQSPWLEKTNRTATACGILAVQLFFFFLKIPQTCELWMSRLLLFSSGEYWTKSGQDFAS